MQLDLKDIEYLLRTSKEDPSNEALIPSCHENNALGMLEPTLSKPCNEVEAPILNPNATCWEILTVMLGRFAREYIDKHGSSSITDDMLQKEARRILYGDPDDVWNQTSADNPEWLSLFKKAHGIDNQIPITGMFKLPPAKYSNDSVYMILGKFLVHVLHVPQKQCLHRHGP